MKSLPLIASLALTLCSVTLGAQESTSQDRPETWSPRVTGAPSLLITPDARSAALGESGLLTADDGFALVHNMSALALAPKEWGVSLSFTPWMPDLTKDSSLSMISGFYSLEDANLMRHSIAMGVRYFNIGSTLAFPKSQQRVFEIRPYELAVDLGYAIRLHPAVSLGLAMRYFLSEYNVAQDGVPSRAQTILGDLSLTYRQPVAVESLSMELTAALAVRNIGGKLTHDGGYSYLFSPASLDMGLGVRILLNESDALSLVVQTQKLMVPQYPVTDRDGASREELRKEYYALSMWQAMGRSWSDEDALRDLSSSFAVEYSYQGRLFGRAGYRYEPTGRGSGAGLTLGGGFRYHMAELDLSYFIAQDTHSPLNNTLRMTLGVDF